MPARAGDEEAIAVIRVRILTVFPQPCQPFCAASRQTCQLPGHDLALLQSRDFDVGRWAQRATIDHYGWSADVADSLLASGTPE